MLLLTNGQNIVFSLEKLVYYALVNGLMSNTLHEEKDIFNKMNTNTDKNCIKSYFYLSQG